MAVAMESEVLDLTVSACADAYMAHGSTVIVTGEPFATVFSDFDAAEVVLDSVSSIEAAIPYIAGLGEQWNVVAVIPAALAGDGHRALRGRFDNVTLQVWWMDGETVCFGQPETP